MRVGLRRPSGRYLGGVLAARRRLLRRREARPDAALHRIGLRDLAPGGAGDRRALPVGHPLVAGHAARRADRQRRAPAGRQQLPDRQPAGPADRQHGGDHRRRAAAAAADRPGRRDGPRRAGGRDAGGARSRDRDQRDGGDGLDARRRRRGRSDATAFWRTWWLGDTSGGLVVLPLLLAWAHDPAAAWRRIRNWEGVAVVASVAALGVIAVSTEEPVTYMVFPALIWAAFRFGPPGATLAVAITAGVAIGVTAHDLGGSSSSRSTTARSAPSSTSAWRRSRRSSSAPS